MAIIERCSNCVFWVQGCCRVRSPIVIEGVVGISSTPTGDPATSLHIIKEQRGPITCWPKVESNDFCGEFELKG